MSTPDSQELLNRLRDGDSEAGGEVFDRYVRRLLALARSRIGARLRTRIDADDVVQSAYRSFFVHAENDEYVLERAGDLWRLLAAITINKLHGQVEKHRAARRDIRKEDRQGSDDFELAREPTPVEAIAMAEQLQLIAGRLSKLERSVLIAQLQGHTIDEIAVAVSKSPRTVRRLLANARKLIEQQLLDSAYAASRDASRGPLPTNELAPLSYSEYMLGRLRGAGGMGKVYQSTVRATGRAVAVKSLLKARQHDACSVAKFLQEAQILASLRHENIVRVEGVGRFPGGGYFIVMEYIDGKDLQSLISIRPLPWRQAIQLVRDVARAIDYAHSQNVAHGDLKPANILVENTGRVVVTDFGLARIISGNPQLHEVPWLIGGTAGYMAPEVRFHGAIPDSAADIYALGALLWAIGTGVAPDGPDAVLGHPHVDEDIISTCARCLAGDPKGRYPSADALANELGRIADRLYESS